MVDLSFKPYKKLYQKLIPKNNFRYYEIYNASEGFFGIQDKNNSDELLLMLDYGIFYEFIPFNGYNEDSNKIIPLSEVKLDTNYAMVICSNAGLGDIKLEIQFVLQVCLLTEYK